MPRTLLVSEIFPPKHGGSGRWFWEIYRRLPRSDYRLLVGEDPRQAEFDTTHDLQLARAPLTMPQWGLKSFSALKDYWRLFRLIRSVVRREKIDRIHVGRCLPEGWLAYLMKRICGVPYISYIHGEDVETASCSRELTFMVRRVLKNADQLIANSHNTARLLRENWDLDDSRITVLHPGCDTTRFIPAARDPAVRNQLGWNDHPVILTVGRLQKRKGHDVMIRSLSAIREAIPDVIYAIIGDGEERQILQELAKSHGVDGSVQFLREVDDRTMIRCYQQCDLFVLPNRQVGRDVEGFGMVLVEAQACGCPVIAGASGGTRETMQEGETGFVVPCETPTELAPLIVKLLLDQARRQDMGLIAREWTASRFGWEQLAQRAQSLFEHSR